MMIEIDQCHIDLIEGLIKSYKPHKVLELGIGAGKTTRAAVRGLQFNQRGKLTCVDNWSDWGSRPQHLDFLESIGVELVEKKEGEFITTCQDNIYDFVISDADHDHAHEWYKDNLRICINGGIMIWHDVTNHDFSNLKSIYDEVQKSHFNHMLLNRSSLKEEMCWRGLLVVINQK